MAAPSDGPCAPWATLADLCTPCDDYDFPAGVLDDALDAASWVLWEKTGRRWSGECEATVRPCTRSSAEQIPTGDGGRVVCGCQSGRTCGCGTLDEITLGGYPVVEVSQVRVRESVGGVLQTFTPASGRYRVDDWRYLVRLNDADGTNLGWPCCQDLAQDVTGDGVYFDVTFTYGREPPTLGKRAAAVLGCELAIACVPETAGLKCRLPRRVQQVARQGLTITMLDPADFFDKGRTGLYEVDLFLGTANPGGLARRAQLISPGLGRRVRRAGT